MAHKIWFGLIIALGVLATCHGAVVERRVQATKVFSYQGDLPPIKDDRTGEVIRDVEGATKPEVANNQTDDGELCWNLIVEQSAVTFALQNKVLDQLEAEMKDLSMDAGLRTAVNKITASMRKSMAEAEEALKNDSPEDYFDSLFDASEKIVAFSSLIRDPELNHKVYLVLVRAVSRLGRNNSALVQEFIDQCSIIERTRPRVLASVSTRS